MIDPIDNVVWKHFSELNANWWNPNRVMKQELALLERSILSTGWVQPVLCDEQLMIVDGFHRWRLSQDSEAIVERYEGMLPVSVLPVDTKTGMVMTVRMNRAKGTHVAVHMSDLVRALVDEHDCKPEWIARQIGASVEEVYLLAGKDVFTARNIENWAYSKAWYPKGSIHIEEQP
jgi:ParB-like chromosome segregation protein Spo0J